MSGDREGTDATRDHYERLLSPVYRWMLGDFESALSRSRAELEGLGIGPALIGARGLDLGAGPGLHAIPLFDMGYRVTAIDQSMELLAQLSGDRPGVLVVHGDILDVEAWGRVPYDVIVCMGDTLTHLPSLDAVQGLLESACRRLARGGVLALTFRDYVSSERTGPDRFIPVRSDDRRILVCCLDYEPDRVRVTDILHERRGAEWTMTASTYAKLRLPREWVVARLLARGATIENAFTKSGRVTVVARAHGGS